MTLAQHAPFVSASRESLTDGPRTPYERDLPIHAVFAQHVATTPHAAALCDAAGTISYLELDRQANRLARHLRAAGVGPGTTVGVAFERSRQLPITLLAILKAGGAYVPLDATYPAERIAFIVADADLAAVIVEQSADVDRRFAATRVISLTDDSVAIAAHDDASVASDVTSESLAYVMYTSGSTGRAKGVAVPHRAVVRLVRGADFFQTLPGETFLHFAPAAFDASTFEIWGALLNGARLAIPRPGLLSIEDLAATVKHLEVTTMWLTASIFQRVVEAQLPEFGALRQLLTGGSAGSPQHLTRFLAAYPTCRLINGYGPTENTTFSTTYHFTSAASIGTNPPIGRPIAHSSAHVLDDDLRPVPLGEPGELCVGGDGVALGYLNLPTLTAARFIADPFSRDPAARLYRTGDRVRMRTDGVIEFLGRTDDQVKIHGYRIELGEIETVLRAHPDVRDAAVVTIEREPGEKTLSAHVVPAAGACIDEQTLRAYVREKLPSYMVPPRIALVAELPLHSSGKIDRVALAAGAARVAAGSLPAARVAAPAGLPSSALRGPLLVRAIAEIWREVLDEPTAPSVDVNFFDAGGDSIRLLQLHKLLNDRLQAGLAVLDLFEHTTIAALATHISAGRRA